MNEQTELLTQIRAMQEQVTQMQVDYWRQYSSFGTWQFWVMVSMIVIPLIVLYILADRKKLFLLCFYGFNIHIWSTYVDSYGVRTGLWEYPYRFFPHFPFSLAIDVALFPVVFMLVYQWTLKHNKNFYLYSIATALIFTMVYLPLLSRLNFFYLYKGMTYFNLFIANVILILVSKVITNIFIYEKRKAVKG